MQKILELGSLLEQQITENSKQIKHLEQRVRNLECIVTYNNMDESFVMLNEEADYVGSTILNDKNTPFTICKKAIPLNVTPLQSPPPPPPPPPLPSKPIKIEIPMPPESVIPVTISPPNITSDLLVHVRQRLKAPSLLPPAEEHDDIFCPTPYHILQKHMIRRRKALTEDHQVT